MLYQIPDTHPALPGHFPSHPVVPGVVILDHILDAVEAAFPGRQVTGVRKMKFLRPLLPGQLFSVQLVDMRDGRLRFVCLQADARLAEGSLLLDELACSV